MVKIVSSFYVVSFTARLAGNSQLLNVIVWSSHVPNLTQICQEIWTVEVGKSFTSLSKL